MKEPWNQFRIEAGTKQISDLEKAAYFRGGTKTVYTCTILNEECSIDKDGSSDCRRCNFALAHLIANPGLIKELGRK